MLEELSGVLLALSAVGDAEVPSFTIDLSPSCAGTFNDYYSAVCYPENS